MIWTFFIAFAVVAVDLLVKYAVSTGMTVGQSFVVIPGVLRITYVQNKGAAFGMLGDHRWVFLILSGALILLLAAFLAFSRGYHGAVYVSAALVLGGGIGNMVDRIALGYVIDSIDVYAFPFWKWVFNVADMAVCIGVFLLLAYLLFWDKKALAAGKKSLLASGGGDKK